MEEVEVSYTAGDIAMMNFVVWRWWLMMSVILAAILALVPVLFALWDGSSVYGAITQIDWRFTGSVLILVIGWIVLVTVIGYWLRRQKGMHGPIFYRLTENGLSVRNRDMDSVIFWPAIKSIKTLGNRVFLFINLRSALIIPRRAFETDAQFEAFAVNAQKNWADRHR